jgi:hypothetical protein
MKVINLTKGKYTIIDDEDFDYLNKYKWHFSTNGYAESKKTIKGKRNQLRMARLILNPSDDMVVDHINRNKLDNRRCNLRIVTQFQNSQNKGFSSKLGKGVYKNQRKNGYFSAITINNKQKYLGFFKTRDEAYLAYKNAFSILHPNI